mmetsp:Transcript_26820/g.56178  ORF Transcript_26820/g.56178 Transcript_26820/m.56178 type:complete len:81 (+) Transcript_26820:66-308(+)
MNVMFTAKQGVKSAARRSWAMRSMSSQPTAGGLPKYSPTLLQAREGEIGAGGRSSDQGIKVALFGASGFLGKYVSAELGT